MPIKAEAASTAQMKTSDDNFFLLSFQVFFWKRIFSCILLFISQKMVACQMETATHQKKMVVLFSQLKEEMFPRTRETSGITGKIDTSIQL